MSWVFNTAVTILVCAGLFYALEYNLAMGILLFQSWGFFDE
jgi:hypothetical protein